jgi:hypothetical protein
MVKEYTYIDLSEDDFKWLRMRRWL